MENTKIKLRWFYKNEQGEYKDYVEKHIQEVNSLFFRAGGEALEHRKPVKFECVFDFEKAKDDYEAS